MSCKTPTPSFETLWITASEVGKCVFRRCSGFWSFELRARSVTCLVKKKKNSHCLVAYVRKKMAVILGVVSKLGGKNILMKIIEKKKK